MPGQSPDAGFEKDGRVLGDDRETLFVPVLRRAGRARTEGLPISRKPGLRPVGPESQLRPRGSNSIRSIKSRNRAHGHAAFRLERPPLFARGGGRGHQRSRTLARSGRSGAHRPAGAIIAQPIARLLGLGQFPAGLGRTLHHRPELTLHEARLSCQ